MSATPFRLNLVHLPIVQMSHSLASPGSALASFSLKSLLSAVLRALVLLALGQCEKRGWGFLCASARGAHHWRPRLHHSVSWYVLASCALSRVEAGLIGLGVLPSLSRASPPRTLPWPLCFLTLLQTQVSSTWSQWMSCGLPSRCCWTWWICSGGPRPRDGASSGPPR